MLEVYYGKSGKPVSDFEVEEMVSDIALHRDYKNHRIQFEVSTENVLFALRVAIFKGELDFNHVVVHTDDGKALTFNKEGKFLNGVYPDSYFDNALDVLIGID